MGLPDQYPTSVTGSSRVSHWMVGLLTVGIVATTLDVGHAIPSCAADCDMDQTPVLQNPGNQTNAVTVEYGYAGAVRMANPISYWRFDDHGGTTLTDWAATPHPGVISGTVTYAQPGALADGSLAMRLDGQSATRMDIPDDAAFRLTNGVSLEMWAKTEQGYATGALFDKTAGAGRAYLLMHEMTNWVWRVVGTFGTIDVRTPVTAEDVGAWVHLVATFDGRTTRLYKNGVLMASQPAEGTLTPDAGVTRIGQLGGNGYAFPGMLDEIAVYGTALSAGQIASHYALRTSAPTVSLQLTASDPDGDALTFSATGLPAGLLINPSTGLISGNPTVPCTASVTVTATDPGGLAASQTFQWTIGSTPAVNPNRPVLTNPGNQTNAVTVDQGYAGAVRMANPISYWRFDDHGGTTLTDWAATPHPGVITGTITYAQPGALADGSVAMRLDGQLSTRIDIPDDAAFRLTNAVSLEVWAKTEQGYATGVLFDKTAGADRAYVLMHETTNWVWRIHGTFGTVTMFTPVTTSDVGNWVHLVGTFDGRTTRLYKNGVLMVSQPAEGTLAADPGVTRIGQYGTGAYAFPGTLDEIAVYGTSLSAGQIASHYALRTSAPSVSLQLTASDPDNDALTLSATGLPAGLLINSSTGLISGNPTVPCTTSVTVTATDPGGLAASQMFEWTIGSTPATNPNRPVLTNPGSQTKTVRGGPGYAGAVLTANPISYWRLDDHAGTTVMDWAATPHPGIISGTVTYAQPGALADGSLAIRLDGQPATRIDISDDAAFRLSNAVTVEVWAKTEQGYVTGALLDKTAGGGRAYLLMHETSYWVWRVVGTFGTVDVRTPVTAEDVGAWVHLVATFDGHATRLYKNGTLMASQAAEGTLAADAGVTRIGQLGGGGYAFPGTLDEIAVYGTALSAGEVASHYALRTSPAAVSITLTASDPDGDPLTFSASGLPTGLLINPSTGLISGNPTQSGSTTVTATVADPGGLTASQSFSLTINVDNVPPTLTVSSPASGATVTTSSIVVRGSVIDTISGVSNVTCNGVAGIITGGHFHCTVTLSLGPNLIAVAAADGVGNISSSSLAVTINPIITSLSPSWGHVGDTITIAGRNFGATQGSSTIAFNGTLATPTSWTDTSIVVAVPSGATSGLVVASIGSIATNGESFTVTTGTPPTITATVSGTPDAAGVYETPPTVTFTCASSWTTIASCTQPVTLTTDASNIAVPGEAIDAAGNHAATSVTVNVDGTAPSITMFDPPEGDTLDTGASTVTVHGSVVDSASGIASVTCNGMMATISGHAFSCTTSVSSGSNSIAIIAMDHANHTSSVDVHVSVGTVAPTGVEITPTSLTIIAGDTRTLRAINDRGRIVTTGLWTSGNTAAVTVSTANGVTSITGVGAGSATVTLTVGALSAQTRVTVLAANSTYADGSQLWTLSGTAPSEGDVLVAVPIDVPEGTVAPGLFFVERGSTTRIRAATLDGRELWRYATDKPVKQVAADKFGGIVMVLSNKFLNLPAPRWNYGDEGSIRRIDGVTGRVSWEYVIDSNYYAIDQAFNLSELAIREDGTIFVTETMDLTTDLVALDGQTGAVVLRFSIGSLVLHRYTDGVNDWNPHEGPNATSPIVLEDGSVNVASYKWESWWYGETNGPDVVHVGGPLEANSHDDLLLYTIGPDALDVVSTPIDIGDYDPFEFDSGNYDLDRLIPDGQGGLLLTISEGGLIYRISNNHVLSGPLQMQASGSRISGETEYVIGDDSAYAVTQAKPTATEPNWRASVVQFNPLTLEQIAGEHIPAFEPVHLRYATDGGGAVYTVGSQPTPVAANARAGWYEGPTLLAISAAAATTSWKTPLGSLQYSNAMEQFRSNYNSIELLTSQTPSQMFQTHLRTLDQVNAGDIARIDGGPITDIGQDLTITMIGLSGGFGLIKFQVESIRYDSAENVMSVKTMPSSHTWTGWNGHPLIGWRYWRAFDSAPGHLIIETGAVDSTAPTILAYLGAILPKGQQLKMWEEFLLSIKSVEGAQIGLEPQYLHVSGVWGFDKTYIMNNVCGLGLSNVCQ